MILLLIMMACHYIYKGAGSGYLYTVAAYTTSANSSFRIVSASPSVVETINTTSGYDVGFIPKEFAINDINIVYREKAIK